MSYFHKFTKYACYKYMVTMHVLLTHSDKLTAEDVKEKDTQHFWSSFLGQHHKYSRIRCLKINHFELLIFFERYKKGKKCYLVSYKCTTVIKEFNVYAKPCETCLR